MAESQKLFIASQALTKRTQEKNRTSNPRQPVSVRIWLNIANLQSSECIGVCQWSGILQL